MTLTQILVFLALIFPGATQPYDLDKFQAAAVELQLGQELFWYEPSVEFYNIPGAPSGWIGASRCDPIFGGEIVINPAYKGDPGVPFTVMHELLDLMNSCQMDNTTTTLRSMEAMAYLNRRSDIIYDLMRRIQVIQHKPRNLDDNVLTVYYRRPIWVMLYGDLAEYPNLRRVLVEMGVREEVYSEKGRSAK